MTTLGALTFISNDSGWQAVKVASSMKRLRKVGQLDDVKLEPRPVSKTLGSGDGVAAAGSTVEAAAEAPAGLSDAAAAELLSGEADGVSVLAGMGVEMAMVVVGAAALDGRRPTGVCAAAAPSTKPSRTTTTPTATSTELIRYASE